MPTDTALNVAMEAKAEAKIASALIRQHVTDCAQRQKDNSDALIRVHDRIDTAGRALIAALATTVMTLLASLAQIVLHYTGHVTP